MATFIVIPIVLGLLAGLIIGLRKSARTGMPSQEVLDRAARHARDLEAADEARQKTDDAGSDRRR